MKVKGTGKLIFKNYSYQHQGAFQPVVWAVKIYNPCVKLSVLFGFWANPLTN